MHNIIKRLTLSFIIFVVSSICVQAEDFTYLNKNGNAPFVRMYHNPVKSRMVKHSEDILYTKEGILKMQKFRFLQYTYYLTDEGAYLKLYSGVKRTTSEVTNYIGWVYSFRQMIVYRVTYTVNGVSYTQDIPLNYFYDANSEWNLLSEVRLNNPSIAPCYASMNFKIESISPGLVSVTLKEAEQYFSQVNVLAQNETRYKLKNIPIRYKCINLPY